MNRIKFIVILIVVFSFELYAQEEYKDPRNKSYVKTYSEKHYHSVKYFGNIKFKKRPKNIILMIGDGMGLAQVFAGMTANKGKLYLENFKHCGFSKTQSADNYVTDSGAGGTALACGVKTYNHGIGVDADGKRVKNIREIFSQHGYSTGVVTTALVNHATPAAFLAHQKERKMYEEIADDIVNSDVDIAVGGGKKHFENRSDGRNLSNALRTKNVKVAYNVNDFLSVKAGRVVGLFADMHIPRFPTRKDMLPECTDHSIKLLNKNRKGFFLMVEASKIDAGGHQNKTPFLVKEMLDFDKAIGEALKFAVKDRETLVIVTADHETGGMANIGGDPKNGVVEAAYVYGAHTGTPVPVFAFGPGAENFTGFMDNTDIPKRIIKLILNKNIK